ncbi:hypothetical protein KR059_008164, partial [Drosophila kikkawai]
NKNDVIDIKDVEALIQCFSGDDGYPILRWINDFEHIMNTYDVPDHRRFIFAKRMLTGSAKTQMIHVNPVTWITLRKELLAIFEQKVTAW